MNDCGAFLQQQRTTLESKLADINKMFPTAEKAKLISAVEVSMLVVNCHVIRLVSSYMDSVNYIEHMLYTQLRSALGKVVQAQDFSDYMLFHNKKIFKPAYQPKPFCFAVRRPNHSPEGTITIDVNDGNSENPIYTTVAQPNSVRPMKFPISSSTSITYTGERYLHGWIDHQFEGKSQNGLSLKARTRQFSCFVVVVGTVVSLDQFEPTNAFLLQNQDELLVPLTLETLPTPKEFQDAIVSLSPEQQRFAKSIRSMQLSSTLFGLVILQIKPALEKVLKLPDDSLTKEIRLTQDLLKLFIEYQIPSDLLSFGGDSNLSNQEKVESVRRNVDAILVVIEDAVKEEAEEAKRAKQMEALKLLETESLDLLCRGSNVNTVRPQMKSKKDGATRHRRQAPMASPFGCASSSNGLETGGFASASAPTLTSPIPLSAPEPVTPEPPKPAQTQFQPKEHVEITPFVGLEEPDYTQIPFLLDDKFAALDVDHSLRPTIIKPDTNWVLKSRKNLLVEQKTSVLSAPELRVKTNQAFDLIDALSRSGNMVFEDAQFHVLIASTHRFDKSVVNTIIQDNVNPIEKVERSMLIVATTIHATTSEVLVKEEQIGAIKPYSAALFLK